MNIGTRIQLQVESKRLAHLFESKQLRFGAAIAKGLYIRLQIRYGNTVLRLQIRYGNTVWTVRQIENVNCAHL